MDQHGSLEDRGAPAVVVVRLPEELRAALRAQAKREDRTVASLLRIAARAYLDGVGRATPPAVVGHRPTPGEPTAGE